MHEPSPDGFTISGEPFTVPPELGYTVEEVWNVVYNLNVRFSSLISTIIRKAETTNSLSSISPSSYPKTDENRSTTNGIPSFTTSQCLGLFKLEQ